MATIGDTSKPSGGWHSFSGSSENQQEAELLTMPVRGSVDRVGAWIGGWNGTCRVYLCVWDSLGALLASTGPITVANEGTGGPAGGNVANYEADVASPPTLAAGAQFFVGFDRHVSDGHQVSVGGAGSGEHYEGRHGGGGAAWPGDLGAATGGPSNVPRRCGAYVASYTAIPGALVRRSGAWVAATTVQVMRSGAWADADAVYVYRSGAWVPAE